MTYVDVSVDITQEMPTWPGSPEITFIQSQTLDKGDFANDTTINFSVHTGTHIDAPLHFLPSGISVEKIPLDTLIGPVFLAEVSDEIAAITSTVLANLNLPKNTKRLLLKTRNSSLWSSKKNQFEPNFVALTSDAAQWVVEQGISVIGIDYLSIQRFHDGPETHQILLNANTLIIEGLNLSQVKSGHYELFCFPLKLKGLEGAPARVILRY